MSAHTKIEISPLPLRQETRLPRFDGGSLDPAYVPTVLIVDDIDLKTFQQGTFGPAEMLKIRVAEETPEAKNCGVRVNTASKIQPSLCWRLELLFFESSGPLRTTVEPDKLPSDDW